VSRVLLQDSGRSNKLPLAVRAIERGLAAGIVLNPFKTPYGHRRHQRGAYECISAVRHAGGHVYFDPTTYGAFAPAADDFAHYTSWPLWPPGRGRDRSALDAHVELAITCQRDSLKLKSCIMPTLALDAPTGEDAERALAIAKQALDLDAGAIGAIVGSTSFWRTGSALDTYVGNLVQFRARRWMLTVTRPTQEYPPTFGADAVAGLCRTAHALSLRAEVLIAYGDLAALPAVAVGAAFVGSGWDLSQRVYADDAFKRGDGGGGGGSYRATHRGLLAALKGDEAAQLMTVDPDRSGRLLPGLLPKATDFNAHWEHHLQCLSTLIDRLCGESDVTQRVGRLRALYEQAATEFGEIVTLIGPLAADRSRWVAPLAEGLNRHIADEGW
jgi:hypothetical protein